MDSHQRHLSREDKAPGTLASPSSTPAARPASHASKESHTAPTERSSAAAFAIVESQATQSLSGWRAYTLILATAGSTFLNVFSTGALTVAIPSIGRALNFSQADLSWPLQAQNLTYGTLLLISGRLADKYGRRPTFLIGTLSFAMFSVLPIFMPNVASFTVVMALLGISSALMSSSAMGVIGGNLKGVLKNRAVAVLAGGQSLGFLLGLVVSGFLNALPRGYRYLYVIQAALGFIFSVLGYVSIPHDLIKYDRELDWAGVALSTAGLALFIFCLSQSQNVGWTKPYIPALLAVSVVLLTFYASYSHRREKRGHSVLLPFAVFKQARFSAFAALIFAAWWTWNTGDYFVNLYYQEVLRLSPLQTGLRFLPSAISGVVVNTAVGWGVEYVPGQWLNAFGACAMIVTSTLIATLDPQVTYWRNTFWIMVLSPAVDAIYTVGNLYTMSSMDERSQALAGGLFGTTTRLATAVGLAATSALASAVSGITQGASEPGQLLKGYHAAGWFLLGMASLGLVVNLIWLRDIGVMGGKGAVRA